jgi:hypothetical protein
MPDSGQNSSTTVAPPQARRKQSKAVFKDEKANGNFFGHLLWG